MITYLEIDSESITDNECYNDYMINLPESINLTNINLTNINIPKNNSENINNLNNQLKIQMDNREQLFELEENYYNRVEIKDFLNEAFNSYDFPIICDIVDDSFTFNSDVKFQMINNDNSILRSLGFNKNSYVNKNNYIAENSMQLGDNIFYIVVENISEEPIYLINNDTQDITKLFEPETSVELDHLIIKFYKTKKDIIKNNKEYSFFFKKNHHLSLELVNC
jgi:hypothetical protein